MSRAVDPPLCKYPRTVHLEGSRLQPGDEDLTQVAYRDLPPGCLIVEEKLDGANAAFSFASDGAVRLQSRGHYLTGGPRERHFAFFKAWVDGHRWSLWDRLGDRYVVYGEWVYAKHTIFYDALPHYFHEFDVLDRETGAFLSTRRRRALLDGLPIVSVPVLWEGHERPPLEAWVGRSRYKSERWRQRLVESASAQGLEVERVERQTDPSDQMEGLYIKVESDEEVLLRCKWIRASFLTSVIDSGSHWLQRPIVPNLLRPDVDLFAAR